MADRFPLILNTNTNQIQEIPSGDNLDLTGVGINNVGVITSGNVTIGAATTDLIVTGDARITGILTVGTSSLKLDGPNNLVNVGTALTLGHTQGLQFHTQNLHSAGFEVNQINASGIITATEADINGNLNVAGVTTFNEDISFKGANYDFLYDRSLNTLKFDQGIASFGTSSPMTLQNTIISGVTNIKANGLYIRNLSNQQMISCYTGAQIELYYNNNKKLNTSNTGIEVTGNATVSGNLSVGGVLTYEDVTNVDSIGIITARNGITVSSGTATFQGEIDANGDLDVDGHTNLDNLSVAGVSTFTGAVTTGDHVTLSGQNPRITFTDSNHNPDFELYGSAGNFKIWDSTNAIGRLVVNSNGNIDISNDLDVDGHTNLDNVSVAGVSTYTGAATFNGSVNSNAALNIGANSQITLASGNWAGDVYGKIQQHANRLYLGGGSNADPSFVIRYGGGDKIYMTSGGTFYPTNDSSSDLGKPAVRWANVYADNLYGNGNNITQIVTAGSTYNSNLDTANTVAGVYRLGTGISNGHSGMTNYGTLFHANNASDTGFQMYVNYNDGRAFLRGGNATTFNGSSGGGYANTTWAEVAQSTRNFIPEYDSNISLGSSSKRFISLWADYVEANNFGSNGQYSGKFGRIRVGADVYGNTIKTESDNNLNITVPHSVYFNTDANSNGSDAGTARLRIYSGGIVPTSNNSIDLGTSSIRWRNIYTNDLNLSNEGGANDVDGTWGKFTIQEGESDLFLINNRNGKKYKFNLTEVS